MTTPPDTGDSEPSSGIPPSAEASTPGEWTPIGSISANHGEILIIANHIHQPADPDARWDSLLAFTARGRSRSVDGRLVTLVADQFAPDWESGLAPAQATEDALVIRTYDSSVFPADARTCDDPDHDGWCELRIKLHNHDPRDPVDEDLEDFDVTLLGMTDEERREATEPDSGTDSSLQTTRPDRASPITRAHE